MQSKKRILGLLLSLVLLAAINGIIFPHAPVQAAPSRAEILSVTYRMFVAPSGTVKLCVGQAQKFYVSLNKVIKKEIGLTTIEDSRALSGEMINTRLGSTRIAQISGNSQSSPGSSATRLESGGVTQATFTVTAKRTGSTEITFSQEVLTPLSGSSPVGAPDVVVNLIVKACRYKVKTYSSWHFYDGFQPSMVSMLENAEIRLAEDGSFSTTSPVTNAARAVPQEGCVPTVSVTSGEASLSGSLDVNGRLKINIAYEPVLAVTTVVCGPESGSSPPDIGRPAAQTVDLDASGGVITQAQILSAYQAVSGTSTIVVIPVDEAAAFMPGGARMSLAASSWLAGWWNAHPFLLDDWLVLPHLVLVPTGGSQ